jgi:hypothetical protein
MHDPEQQSAPVVQRSQRGAQPPIGAHRPPTQSREQQSFAVAQESHTVRMHGLVSAVVHAIGGAQRFCVHTPEQQSCPLLQISPITRHPSSSVHRPSHVPPQHCGPFMHVSPAGKHGGPGGLAHVPLVQTSLQQSCG